MFSVLRDRLGVPGVVSVVALVFAMSGSAFAAKYLITSTKQIKPSVLKKLKGPPGVAGANGGQGPQGVAGPAGPAGGRGATGATGATGANGVSVTETAIAPGGACGAVGGVAYTTASGTTNVCSGSPWTAGGTLPAGQTETGSYSVTSASGTGALFGVLEVSSITFNIPLAAELDGSHVILVTGAVPDECEDSGNAEAASTANPEADPGYLCVFQGTAVNMAPGGVPINKLSPFEAGASRSGALISYAVENPQAVALGSWAVTAPSTP